MSDCKPSPEVKRILRAMAKAQVEAGVTSADDIVDSIHAAIRDHTPLWKGEIAEIVGDFGEKAKATKSELQQKLSALRKELKENYGNKPFQPKEGYATTREKPTPDEAKNARRQAEIKKQIAKIDEQIRTGDFAKEPPRPRYTPDEETLRLQADLMRARSRADVEMNRIAYSKQSLPYRIASTGSALARAAILSGLSVFEHLIGASAWRLVSTLAEDAAGAGVKLVLPDVDRIASVEGGGFGAGGHIAGLKGTFSRQTARDMRDKLLKGASDRQALYGQVHSSSHPWLDWVGRLHDVIKTPIENYAFGRAYWRGSQQARRAMESKGLAADAIDKVMATDSMHAALSLKAYEKGLEAKLQGKNAVVDAVNRTLSRGDASGNPLAQIGVAAVRFQTPIIKIPMNLAKEVAEYVTGGLLAATHARGVIKKAGALSPEAADYVLRAVKKNAVGALLIGVGWTQYKHFGGLYRPHDEGGRPNKSLGYGDTEIPGIGTAKDKIAGAFGGASSGHDDVLTHHWTHSAAWSLMHAAALAHYVLDEDLQKAATARSKASALSEKMANFEGGKNASKTLAKLNEKSVSPEAWEGVSHGIGIAVRSILGDLPFSQTVSQPYEALKGGEKGQKFVGDSARRFIPAEIQAYAKEHDTDASGETVFRKPHNVKQEIETGIPGHGFDTPFGHVPGRLDVPTE